MLGKKLTNALFDYTFLSRKGNRLCVFSKKIKNKYDKIEQAENGDRKRENRDHEGENKSRKG